MSDATPLRITVDTNLLDDDGMGAVRSAIEKHGIEVAIVTVTERERGQPTFGLVVVRETAVWDESRLDAAVYASLIPEPWIIEETPLGAGAVASETSANVYEECLRIISNGSFPKRGNRDHLTNGEQHQLRDAMILEAHTREGRDIFVTIDARGFIGHGRRVELERLCSTRIMTPDEFVGYLETRHNE